MKTKSALQGILLLLCAMCFFGCGPQYNLEFVEKNNQVDVMVNDQLLTTYMYDSKLSKPFLYPVYSPSGELVTRSYPFKDIEGESHDHPHHTGIYFTYGNGEVNGNTFWGNRDVPPRAEGSQVPQIRQVEIQEMVGGKGYGKIKAMYHWVDTANHPILQEDRLMEFHIAENQYIMDFTMQLSALDEQVNFEDTKEGMFAIRVADWLAENAKSTLFESTGEYLNAEGDRTEKNIWGKQSDWVRLEGEKDGKKIGIVIFHHPTSVNYPTYWHARGYGCFSANPIGQHDFQRGNKVENPQHRTYTLNRGEKGLFKFRLMIYEGARTKEQLDQDFDDFSKS